VVPLGASHGAGVKVDFRLVSATHAALEARVEEGLFRADLFARIRGLDVELPPLRLRRMDVGLLVRTLLVRAAGASAPEFRFDRRCAEALVAHQYPLNVRELEQALKTLVVLSSSDHILRGEDLASTSVAGAARPSTGPPGAPAPPARVPPDAIRADLLQQLASHQGNISAVARTMRRTRMQVHRWLKRWNIDPRTFRGEP
jgi:DNA-binding NtrC family response regulator